jgi:glutathione S-transferase
MPVKVYGAAQTPCTMRVMFAAFELGHPLDLVTVNFAKREEKQPAHLARQPFGKVPAIQDGDFSLYESRAICRYLVDKYAENSDIKLVPSDIKERAIFEQWVSLESTTYTPELSVIVTDFYGARFYGKPRDQEACKKAVANLLRDGHVLNKQLEGKTWIVNDNFSLVDIFLLPFLMPIVNEPEIKEWFAKYPNIGAWYEHATARPAWQKVVKLAKF